jgi:hypothetical protein
MTQAVTLAQAGNQNGTFRNKIINGAMVIDQRNAGASSTCGADQTFITDRFCIRNSTALTNKLTAQQNAGSVTPPPGFTNYFGVTSSSSYSVAAGDYFAIQQSIEGYNIADLDFGKSTAKTITLSFWVRSSLTGTFGGSLNNSAYNRGYPFTYTIPSANTWTQISVIIPGDTSGTWLTNNGTGIQVFWGLGTGANNNGTAGAWGAAGIVSATGATSVVGTSGATFYLTGVQLEIGTVPTAFELRSYSKELMMCQRYCNVITFQGYETLIGVGFNLANNRILMDYPLCVQMRTQPSATLSGAASNIQNIGTGTWYGASSVSFAPNPYACRFDINYAAGYFTQNAAAETRIAGGSVIISAEL